MLVPEVFECPVNSAGRKNIHGVVDNEVVVGIDSELRYLALELFLGWDHMRKGGVLATN
jgi:hypothetical protein